MIGGFSCFFFTTIPMAWNDRTQTLTIGDRQGSYPGMIQNRQFTVVFPDGNSQKVNWVSRYFRCMKVQLCPRGA